MVPCCFPINYVILNCLNFTLFTIMFLKKIVIDFINKLYLKKEKIIYLIVTKSRKCLYIYISVYLPHLL